MFVYIRRYEKEMKKAKKRFFNAIRKEFPDDVLTIKGDEILINGCVMGYLVVLSTANYEKSSPFDGTKWIKYDEFLVEKGYTRYMPNEIGMFWSILESVIRLRDDVRVIMLANAVTQYNLYFSEFNVELPRNKKQIKVKDDVLVQLVLGGEYSEIKKQTRLGRLQAKGSHGDYIIDNKFLLDNNDFIRKKPPVKMSYTFSLMSKGNGYGVYRCHDEGIIYVSTGYDPTFKLKYVTMLDDHKPNTMLLKGTGQSVYVKNFIKDFKAGLVWYDSPKTKAVIYETIKHTY